MGDRDSKQELRDTLAGHSVPEAWGYYSGESDIAHHSEYLTARARDIYNAAILAYADLVEEGEQTDQEPGLDALLEEAAFAPELDWPLPLDLAA